MKDEEAVERILNNFEDAGLDERRLAMLRYAKKLTLAPRDIEKSDVESLRSNGFEDIDILGICEVVGYYAYANRIVDGLGVELE